MIATLFIIAAVSATAASQASPGKLASTDGLSVRPGMAKELRRSVSTWLTQSKQGVCGVADAICAVRKRAPAFAFENPPARPFSFSFLS